MTAKTQNFLLKNVDKDVLASFRIKAKEMKVSQAFLFERMFCAYILDQIE